MDHLENANDAREWLQSARRMIQIARGGAPFALEDYVRFVREMLCPDCCVSLVLWFGRPGDPLGGELGAALTHEAEGAWAPPRPARPIPIPTAAVVPLFGPRPAGRA